MKHHLKIHLKLVKLNNFIIAIALLFFIRVVFSFLYWHPDVTNHMDWGIRLFEYTPINFYSPDANVWNFTWPNQPPGSMYIFGIVRIIYNFIFGLLLLVNNSVRIFPSMLVTISEFRLYPALLQFPAIFFDFAIAYLIFKLTKSKVASLIFLANPVVWYNSSVWGQYDSIVNFFFLAGFYFANKKRLFLSICFVAISLYIKISLVILVPIYVIFLLKKNKISDIFLQFFWVCLLIILLTVPFSGLHNPVHWLYKLYVDKVLTDQLHVITANAFNFWAIFTGVDWIPNSLPLLGKTYEFWGLLLFGIISAPLYIKAFLSKRLDITLFVCGILYFTAWMFLTNMHERYLYPFFVFSLPLIIKDRVSLKLYGAVALLSLFNMYYLWFVPQIIWLISIVKSINPSFVSILFLVLYIYFYILLLRKTSSKKL